MGLLGVSLAIGGQTIPSFLHSFIEPAHIRGGRFYINPSQDMFHNPNAGRAALIWRRVEYERPKWEQ